MYLSADSFIQPTMYLSTFATVPEGEYEDKQTTPVHEEHPFFTCEVVKSKIIHYSHQTTGCFP